MKQKTIFFFFIVLLVILPLNYGALCAGTNCNTATSIGVLDIIPPSISFNEPTTNEILNINFTYINISITDDSNISICLLEWNLITNYTMNKSGNANCTYNMTDLIDGNYTFKIYVNDTAGNTNNSETLEVMIDTTYPIINLIAPDNDTYKSNMVTFIFNFTEINAQNTSLYINNILNQSNSTLTNFTIDHTFNQSFTEGMYTWNITVCDSAENCNTSETYNFTIDNTNPVVNIVYPTHNLSFTNTLNISLNYTTTDTYLDTCWYSIQRSDGVYETENTTIINCANTTIKFDYYMLYIIYLYANDTAGNIGVDNHTIYTWAYPPAPTPVGGGSVGVGFETTYLNCPEGYTPFEGACIPIEERELSYWDNLVENFKNIGTSVFPSHPVIGWFVFMFIISILILGSIYIKKHIKEREKNE